MENFQSKPRKSLKIPGGGEFSFKNITGGKTGGGFSPGRDSAPQTTKGPTGPSASPETVARPVRPPHHRATRTPGSGAGRGFRLDAPRGSFVAVHCEQAASILNPRKKGGVTANHHQAATSHPRCVKEHSLKSVFMTQATQEMGEQQQMMHKPFRHDFGGREQMQQKNNR